MIISNRHILFLYVCSLFFLGQSDAINTFDQLQQQIDGFDVTILEKQKALLASPPEVKTENITPYSDPEHMGNHVNFTQGKQDIAEGLVGCIIVAGGQGTRLRFDGPKGMYPITCVRQKSLFQLYSEKVIAASKQAGRPLPLAVMTSPVNDDETRQFFAENNNFGLDENQLYFYSQKNLPMLTPEGDLFLEAPDTLAKGPDGNGYSIKYFVESGIWEKWNAQGVRYVNYVLIDNPLADPFDAELIGFHHLSSADITIKCTKRRDENEKVGLVVKREGHPGVIEYTEIPDAEAKAVNPDGSLKYDLANISLFCFSMDFVKRCETIEIPYHLAFKVSPYVNSKGEVEKPSKPNAWKFETFIFDLLPFAQSVKVWVCPREVCFAPLKNFEGSDCPATVRKALQDSDRRQLEKITGVEVPEDKEFELSQDFYYPTEELLERWKGRELGDRGYIIGLL